MEEPKKLEIEIVSRELIKPSSPTPHHLRNFNLNIYDQIHRPSYVVLLLFYPNTDQVKWFKTLEISQKSYVQVSAGHDDLHGCLKSSFSETLTLFYPLAGRLVKQNPIIDCNDAGAAYVEARVTGARLSDVLRRPNPKLLSQLLPGDKNSGYAEPGTGCLVAVQANLFECGGLGVGVCFCHKVADAATIGAFIKGWAAASRGYKEMIVPPEMTIASRFPAVPLPEDVPTMTVKETKCASRRYVFNAASIAELKAKAASTGVPHPTRVEAVSGIIWKYLIESSISKPGRLCKSSVVGQSMNLRRRVHPPLPDHSLGNFMGSYLSEVAYDHDHGQFELQALVAKLRKGLEDVNQNFVKKLEGDEGFKAVFEAGEKYATCLRSEEIDCYIFSSWCRFGVYDADFLWGKPAWACTVGDAGLKNVVVLMDARDGEGVEARVTLLEEDLIRFDAKHELLEFASLNPSIILE